jgi:hypothetical protein
MRVPGVRTALGAVVLGSIALGPPLALWHFRSVYLPDPSRTRPKPSRG